MRTSAGQKAVLTFQLKVIALWEVEARQFVEANADLILQAIKELRETYEEVELSRQLLWLRTLLHRAQIVSPKDQLRVEENLNMFERLFEEDPYIQKMQAKGEARGKLQEYAQQLLH